MYVARWMVWQIMRLSPYIKPVDKPNSPKSFWPFPWEQPDDDELKRKAEMYRITPEEEAELNRILMEWEASNNQ